jgi:hypothetical protein
MGNYTMINLDSLLSKFENINDFDIEGRHFRTHTPNRAPKAYLNIFYSAINLNKYDYSIIPSEFSNELSLFYQEYNGGRLFAGSFYIYGFWAPSQLLDRSNFKQSLPYNIVDQNNNFLNIQDKPNLVNIGVYSYDLSEVCLDKNTGMVFCYKEQNILNVRAKWNTFNEWIITEINRLSELFSPKGQLLFDLSETLPKK